MRDLCKISVIWSAWACAGVGCASSPPPRELLDARTAYHRAETGDAVRETPGAMQEARLALDRAERAYRDDADSPRVRDIAYIAERKAEFAEVQADMLLLAREEHAKKEQQSEQAAKAANEAKVDPPPAQPERDAARSATKAAEARARAALDQLALTGALAVKEEARGLVLTLPGDALFASGKSELSPSAFDRLNQLADALKDETDHAILIEGHTDSRGSDSLNTQLAQRRAEAVRDYLVSRDIESQNLNALGFGSNRPVADNATADGRAANRRIEIVIEPLGPQ